MSTGSPPAPEVASMSTSASSSAPAGRRTGAITPVEVSLCAQAYASTPASARGSGLVPGAELITVGAPRNGAPLTTVTNLAENSPNDRCWARSRISPNAAMSQNAVLPPLPSTTSYPSGSSNSAANPSRTCRTSARTGACRCDVPSRVLASPDSACTACGRTFDGPQPKRPSAGLRLFGSSMVTGPPWAGEDGPVSQRCPATFCRAPAGVRPGGRADGRTAGLPGGPSPPAPSRRARCSGPAVGPGVRAQRSGPADRLDRLVVADLVPALDVVRLAWAGPD